MIKQPGEDPLTFTYQFDGLLGGASIANVSPATIAARNGGALMTKVAQGTVGTDVLVKWSGGVPGESYLTTVRCVDSNGDAHEIDGVIDVAEVGFVIPVGVSSAMLTGEQYVQRFGVTETQRITDEKRLGIIDKDKLQAAITAATEEVSGYVGVRYALPLVSIPAILQTFVEDLARERLFPNNPPAIVKDNAERARTQLKDISRGLMVLPIDTGQTPATAAGYGSAVSGDRRATVFGRCELDDFTSLSSGLGFNHW